LASVWVRERDGARTIAFDPGTSAPLTAHDLPDGVIEQARILHTNGRHEAAWFEATRRARNAGVTVSFDGGANRFREEARGFLPWIDVAIVSLDWAERFAGKLDPLKAAEAIRRSGPGLVVVTDGLRGSWIVTSDGSIHQLAFALPETIDTTGCGDVYHGAFLSGLIRDWPLERCAAVASAAAAINSCELGGRGRLPDLDEIEVFLRTRQIACL
jgi:sulfofructose kinase